MAEGKYRNLNNEEYWKKRAEERVNRYWKRIGNVEKEVAKQYRLSFDLIRQLVIDLFERYSNNERITYQEAIKSLTIYEIGDFKAKLNRVIVEVKESSDPFVQAELNKLRQVEKVTRFQSLIALIEAHLVGLGNYFQSTLTDWLSKVFESNYYRTIYEFQKGTGLGSNFQIYNENAIKEAITTPLHGDMFSSRIWDNKNDLVKNLRQVIVEGLIKGESNQVMAKRLQEKMNSNYSNALRLIRTETAHILSESTRQGYKQNGSGVLSQYQLLATPSDRTCEICMKLDGNVFDLDDKRIPVHPNCACTEIPYFSDDNMEKLQRYANVNGESFYIPATMTMQEFQDRYIKKSVPI